MEVVYSALADEELTLVALDWMGILIPTPQQESNNDGLYQKYIVNE